MPAQAFDVLAGLLLIQTVAGPHLPAPPRPRSDKPCPVVSDTTDVVVCARNDDSYRLPRLPAETEREGLGKAQVRVGSAALAAETEQVELAGGQQSKRLMMRLRLPIGGKRRTADR